MKRRDFVLTSAAAAASAPLLGITGRGGKSISLPLVPTPGPSNVGPLLAARLNATKSFPDAQLLNLLTKTAQSVPSPQQVEVALWLLGSYGASAPASVPTSIPPAAPLSFPADHGEHFDAQIEWRYITLSLPLPNGGLISVMGNFFRKQIVLAADSPSSSPLDRQLYSTSMGVTIEMPNQPGVHYALPTTTFAAVDGTISVGNAPFHMTIGTNSLTGGNDVFPLHVHIADDGDVSVGRPSIVVDVDCAATNPLFLQGVNGYVGPTGPSPSVGWYYYSWPQQRTTGTVTIGGVSYAVSNGTAWMDHQWGGSPLATSGPISTWSGWCWFEFQFDGDRSLTLSAPHGPVVGGVLPPNALAFGTYIDNGVSTIVYGTLNVSAYVQSPKTTARYPSAWSLAIASIDKTTVVLAVTPSAPIQPQTLWMGQITEYSEANCAATAMGTISGAPITMTGVGYCEGVGFEDPALEHARQEAFLTSKLP